MKKWVPHFFTFLNLLCGCIGAVFAFQDDLLTAGIFVGLGIFFDFFDGLAARLLNVPSELGKQLDSLADMVTSGLVPGIVMMHMLADALGTDLLSLSDDTSFTSQDYWINNPWFTAIGFLVTIASGYRLAKFNIDTRQTSSFIGLPTPANAILIISLGIIAQSTTVDFLYYVLNNPYLLILITIISCILLNAELPLFALKFKNWGWKGNEIRYVFILLCAVMIPLLQIYAIPSIIVVYVLLSVVNNNYSYGV